MPWGKAENRFIWLKTTPVKFKFFVGLNEQEFETLFEFLSPDEASLQRWGAEEPKTKKRRKNILMRCQLAMTLWRLRRGTTLTELSYHFEVDSHTVGKIFSTWIQFLFCKFSLLRDQMFVPRSYHLPLPSVFQNSLLKNTRIVIDCSEILTESSRHYKQQGNIYSSYKSHATAKVLIGIAPSGACMFVSDAYEGSISDREIVKKSGMIDFLKEGDLVLADKGFTIEDLCAVKNSTLLIPPFLSTGKKLTKEQTVVTKLIAKSRIHVERFNERFKKWRLLSGIVPIHVFPLLSQSVFIACCLVNFQEPLVK
jgi:hypothetical protein